MKFRYIYFVAKMQNQAKPAFFTQVRFLDKVIDATIRRQLYQNTKDFEKKYKNS